MINVSIILRIRPMNAFGYLCVLGSCVSLAISAAEQPTLDAHLEPLRPLLGKTWKGTFKSSKPDRSAIDIMRWEGTSEGW